MDNNKSEKKHLCECGCGQETAKNRRGEYNRYVLGHNPKHSKSAQATNNGNKGQFQPGNQFGKGRDQ